MRLLNFSIGQVRTVQIGADTIRTAHVKSPQPEPWIITGDGAAGDERAVHPDKIYAFARSGYAYWGAQLGVDPATWPDGFFGENLTLDDLDERDVCVGDVFAIGEEVRLVVSGARTPCLKLAWRLGQPRTFQKVFAKSRRSGGYFGVLTPGRVRPGDAVTRIQHDPTMPSIADVCDFIADHKPPPLEPLQRLLAFDKLSPAVRLLLTSKLDAAERAAAATEGRWRGWRAFEIDTIDQEAPEIRSVYLRAADGAPLCQPRPGQFVSVRMRLAGGETVTRSWSLSAFAQNPDRYRLTVRRLSGPGSTWVHQAKPGAAVMLRAPVGEFTLDMGGFRPVVLIAAGIGITPLFAMLQAQLARAHAAPVYMFYGVRTLADAAFRKHLDSLAAQHEQFTLHYICSRSDEAGRPAGRMTPEFVIERLKDLHIVLQGHRVDLPWHESDMYLCGPGDFCREFKDAFVARGANADHILTELFIPAIAEITQIEEATVRFAGSDLTCVWSAGEDLSLLELAERAGVAIQSDCRAGSCLTCRTAVRSGSTTADLGDGGALLCVGRPKTARLVLDC